MEIKWVGTGKDWVAMGTVMDKTLTPSPWTTQMDYLKWTNPKNNVIIIVIIITTTPATSVFLKCIVNIQIQAVCLQIIWGQLRAINRWKGTECSDYLVSLSVFLEGLLFSHYSCHLLSCHLLACACVVADWIAWNKTENHCVTFTCSNVLFLNQILESVLHSHLNCFSSYYIYTCMILILIGTSDW